MGRTNKKEPGELQKPPKRDWQGINTDEVIKAVTSPEFIHKSACGCKISIFTFRIPGQFLEGRLRTCPNHDRADRAKCAHLFWLNDEGKEVGVAIRLSKMLWEAIENKGDRLWGRWIRITYRGSIPTRFVGNAQKIYLVEYDKGTITERFETVPTKPTKNRKPRKRRPVCRPMAGAKT